MYTDTKKEKIIMILLIGLLFIIAYIYYDFIIYTKITQDVFSDEIVSFAKDNEKTIFTVDKIVMYSSADAIDNTIEQNLQKLNICQYTDIAIFIKNRNEIQELSEENIVNKMYIDNIKIEYDLDIGNRMFCYKSPYNYGKFRLFEQEEFADRIDFNVLNTNEQNSNNDYNEPTFYTDCSNPISLGYLNKNIVTNFAVKEENASNIVFNGKLLETTNVNLLDIKCTISFRLHIINNVKEEFVTDLKLDIPLENEATNIYSGNMIDLRENLNNAYKLIKI